MCSLYLLRNVATVFFDIASHSVVHFLPNSLNHGVHLLRIGSDLAFASAVFGVPIADYTREWLGPWSSYRIGYVLNSFLLAFVRLPLLLGSLCFSFGVIRLGSVDVGLSESLHLSHVDDVYVVAFKGLLEDFIDLIGGLLDVLNVPVRLLFVVLWSSGLTSFGSRRLPVRLYLCLLFIIEFHPFGLCGCQLDVRVHGGFDEVEVGFPLA